MNIQQLPTDLWPMIFLRVGVRTFARCLRVCSLWRRRLSSFAEQYFERRFRLRSACAMEDFDAVLQHFDLFVDYLQPESAWRQRMALDFLLRQVNSNRRVTLLSGFLWDCQGRCLRYEQMLERVQRRAMSAAFLRLVDSGSVVSLQQPNEHKALWRSRWLYYARHWSSNDHGLNYLWIPMIIAGLMHGTRLRWMLEATQSILVQCGLDCFVYLHHVLQHYPLLSLEAVSLLRQLRDDPSPDSRFQWGSTGLDRLLQNFSKTAAIDSAGYGCILCQPNDYRWCTAAFK